MNDVEPASSPGHKIKQARGRKTYDALLATGFKLLENRELESISIAELAKAAGYSVGAFYARFRSKDEFFDAMIAQHLEHRTRARTRLFAKEPDETLIDRMIEELVRYYWKRRRFWRAALIRSVRSPDFWEPLRQHGRIYADMLIARMSAKARRPLSEAERTNVRFAFQIALGTINNAIINRPGPIMLGQSLFVANLARAFRLVAGYDDLMGIAPKS
ncbi:MAG TPA: TetR/AcrR family transcriptional regulator [Gammaproteobacteria bacterium]|nr:TetR/AcrR family transcriptional regulator [Gammaproteobacteria bacterium]